MKYYIVYIQNTKHKTSQKQMILMTLCSIIVCLLIFYIVFSLFYPILAKQYHEAKEQPQKKIHEDDDLIPTVEFPFKNLFDDQGEKLNIVLISAPFRSEEHEQLYEKYKKKGLAFCGISSYLEFPGKIDNPYEDRFHEERQHDYTQMVSTWLYCFRHPPPNLLQSGLPMMLLAEADLKDPLAVEYNPHEPKEYDFIYVCLNDGDGSKCEPGWNWYIRNWDLAKQCLEVMCKHYKLRGVIVGRQNCEFTEYCTNIVKVFPYLEYHDFQKLMRKCRFLFAPNLSDASPRVITEAICYNMPVLVNYNILGGWNNVIPGVTGEFFTNEVNVSVALDALMTRFHAYKPRAWFMENRGKTVCGAKLADFLVTHYPNINNKSMEYATITI